VTDVPVIDDFIVLGVPDDASLEREDTVDALERLAELQILNQYEGRRPRALLLYTSQWLITGSWEEALAFQPAHDCVACQAGNDQAVAFLKEFPDKKLALGNLHYTEIW
jgi:hypothetical protein